MFTGLVEEVGRLVDVERRDTSSVLTLEADLLADCTHGDSVAVNGVCLTVVRQDGRRADFDVMHETLRCSSLGDLDLQAPVNLERAMPAGGRLGGHVVQGHVDGTAEVIRREPGDHWETVALTLPSDLARYVVEKGSITVDGVSLTVAALTDGELTVSLIPTTLNDTVLGQRRPGDRVNLEVDVLAKYVERLLEHRFTAGAGTTGAHA